MDDIAVTVCESQLKRKAGPSEPRPGKSARVDGGQPAPGAERTGGGGGGRPGPSHRSRAAPDLGSLDLEAFKASQNQPAATGTCTSAVPGTHASAVKVRVPGKDSGKAVMNQDDLDSNLVYVNDQGKKWIVQRFDYNYKSASVAGCLPESIALDGDCADMDGKSLKENLRLIDLSQCLLISGYCKLKEIAQIAESEKDVGDGLREELKNVQLVQVVEKQEFDALKVKYQDVCLEKVVLGNELAEVKIELKTVTGYAKHCKEVAQKANDAYNVLDADYA